MPDDSYHQFVAQALVTRSREIADRWLQALDDVVFEETRDIFPTDTYLDHVPEMIRQMGHILADGAVPAPCDPLITQKATELGQLRFEQKASLSQLLLEYDRLSDVLDALMGQCVTQWGGEEPPEQALATAATLQAMVRSIMRTTVEGYVEQYQAQLKTERDKVASFNSFVSHELRQPLQAASLFLELLQGSAQRLEDDDRENLSDAASAVHRASDMLADLSRSIVSPELASASDVTMQRMELTALTEELARQLESLAKRKSVRIQIADDLGELTTDRAKLQMILVNLLSNSIKYSDPEKSSCWVRVSRSHDIPAHQVRLTVEDNGVGVDSSMHRKVFELKARARSDEDDSIEGYGLGLYLVAEAVKDLDGSIELCGVPGEGTTVTLTIPDIDQCVADGR